MVLTSTETIRLMRDGEKGGGGGGMEGGKREIIYLSLHCHHQNDSCIKMDVTTRMIPALRWTAMRAILMFQ